MGILATQGCSIYAPCEFTHEYHFKKGDICSFSSSRFKPFCL